MLKVFSSDSCGYCRKLKSYLDSKRVQYDVIDVSESEENYNKLISISGQSGIPVTLFDSGEYVIGYDTGKIDSLLESKA